MAGACTLAEGGSRWTGIRWPPGWRRTRGLGVGPAPRPWRRSSRRMRPTFWGRTRNRWYGSRSGTASRSNRSTGTCGSCGSRTMDAANGSRSGRSGPASRTPLGPRRPSVVTWLAVGGGLDLVQLRVGTARVHELVVTAGLKHPSTVEYHDVVGHPYRGEAVGHQDADAAVVCAAPAAVR